MKNILVTGAKGNLGNAVVKTFLQNNHKVIACISLKDKELGIDHPDVSVFSIDLNDSDACNVFSQSIFSQYKTIDAAVLTVGGFIPGNMEAVTIADFEKMIALNFYTAFNLVQPLIKQMKQQISGGKIILIGSGPGKDVTKGKGSVAYGFSKSLVFRLAELINEEGKEKSITAHVIVPTTIDTPQNRAAMPNADFSKWESPESIALKIMEISLP